MIGSGFVGTVGFGFGGSSPGNEGDGVAVAKLLVAISPHTACMIVRMFC